MIVYATQAPIDPNIIAAENFRLAQIRHRIFSENSYVRELVGRDDEFMNRIGAVKKAFADLVTEADRLLAEAVKTPSATTIADAALKRAGLQVAKEAREAAESAIRRERYLWLESTEKKRKAVVAALWEKFIAEVKKSPETEHAHVHVLRVRDVNSAEGRIEVLTKGVTYNCGVANCDHADPETLRAWCTPPTLQQHPAAKRKGFAYEEPHAAKEARANLYAELAKEESRKHGFVSAYLKPSQF